MATTATEINLEAARAAALEIARLVGLMDGDEDTERDDG